MKTNKQNDEKKRRERATIEEDIKQGLLQAYKGLYRLWQEKLYLPDFASFEDYLATVWGYSPSYGHRLIGYVEFIAQSEVPNLDQYLSAGAYRPLHRLKVPEEKQKAAEILKAYIEIGARVTHHVTEEIARKIKPELHTPDDAFSSATLEDDLPLITKEAVLKIDTSIDRLEACKNQPSEVIAGFLKIVKEAEEALAECFGTKKPAEARKLAEAYVKKQKPTLARKEAA